MIMRRYTPFAFSSSTGAAPPGSDSPLPGTFSVHSGAFSLASRLADAYSARTFFQSHWSSSATIIGLAVNTPVPSSVWPTRMVTVSSGAIVIQALISGTDASRYQGWAATAALAASALGGIQNPRTIAPPTAAVVVRNSRRSISVLFSATVFPSPCSGFFSLMMSSCGPDGSSNLVWFLEGTPVFYHLAPTASRRTRSSEVWCPGCRILKSDQFSIPNSQFSSEQERVWECAPVLYVQQGLLSALALPSDDQ